MYIFKRVKTYDEKNSNFQLRLFLPLQRPQLSNLAAPPSRICLHKYALLDNMLPLWFLDLWVFTLSVDFLYEEDFTAFHMSPTTTNLSSLLQTPITEGRREKRLKKVWGLVLLNIVKCTFMGKEENKITASSYSSKHRTDINSLTPTLILQSRH